MFKKKESIEIMRDWINSEIFQNILKIINEEDGLKKDECDKLNAAVAALNADDADKHMGAIADIGSMMNKFADSINNENFEPLKVFAKHTAFIADELSGEDSLLYTNNVGSWLLGTDVVKNTVFPNYKDERFTKLINDPLVPFSLLFSNNLRDTKLADYLKATEKRCELEKKTRNKLLDEETKADLKQEMKNVCDSIVSSLSELEENANKGGCALTSPQIVSNEIRRIDDQKTALESGWDISRLSDVNVINSVLISNSVLEDLNSAYELDKIPELKKVFEYSNQLSQVPFFNMNRVIFGDEDEAIDQEGVDKCYVDFFNIMKKLTAEVKKPEVREAVNKLVENGSIPENSNDLLTGLVNQDDKYSFALESTYLVGKNYVPLDKEKGAKASLYNQELHHKANIRLIDSFKESVDEFVKEAKALYRNMRVLTINNPKASQQFREMHYALARATSINAEGQSPEEIMKIIDDLSKAGTKYVSERGKKANAERLGVGKKIAELAKSTHSTLKEQIKDTYVGMSDTIKVVDMEEFNGRTVNDKNITLRSEQRDNVEDFKSKTLDLKKALKNSMDVFTTSGVEHYYSKDSSPTYKALYNACMYFSETEVMYDKNPKEIVEALQTIAKAADDYDKEHSGISNLTKGVSGVGRQRVNAARLLSKEIKKELPDLIAYCSKLHGIKENETLRHYNNRTLLEKKNYDLPKEERLTDKQIEDELVFNDNYQAGKTVRNEMESQRIHRRRSNIYESEIVRQNIAIMLVAEKYGEKALLKDTDYYDRIEILKEEDIIHDIANDNSMWDRNDKLDTKKALEKYKEAVLEREAQIKEEKRKAKAEEIYKKKSFVKNRKAKSKVDTSLEQIAEEPEIENSNSINIINEEPVKKAPKKKPEKNPNSINIINEEPVKKAPKKKEPEKNPNSINIINEEPKKTEPKKQEVVFDAEITKNSPFYSSQRMINSIINYAPPKSQKEFETLRDHMILNLSEIVTKTVFSAMESKELNKAEFFSQYPESDGNIEETMMLKQIFNSEPMQSLEKEITSWEELVKLGKSALSENAQPFLMNYGIRNHKSFENNKNKSAENMTQKRVKTTEKETNGPTLKPTNIKK